MAHLPDTLADLVPHVLHRAPGQGLLHVDPAVEEHLPAELALLRGRVRMPRDLRGQAVVAVDGGIDEPAHEGLRDRAAGVELELPVRVLLQEVFLDLAVAALVVREELALEHRQGEERGLLARQILGAQPDPVEVLAALVDDRLGEVDLDVDQLVQHGIQKLRRFDEVGEDLRIAHHVLRLLEQPPAPALAHQRERRLLADELAVLAQRHPRDRGVVEHGRVVGVGPGVGLQLAQPLFERRAGGVEERVADHLVVAALLVRGPLADDPPFVDVDLDVRGRDPHVEGHFLEPDGAEAG